MDGFAIPIRDLMSRARWSATGPESPQGTGPASTGLECKLQGSVIERNRVALVVLLRGVNVGGHRTFRPTKLAEALKHLGAVNIGAAGTLVIRQRMTQARARAEVARRLPFAAEIVVCQGRDIVRLLSERPFERESMRRNIVRFVSVLSRRPRSSPSTPVGYPGSGQWQMKILARRGRFVIGMYRRQMKAIGFLGTLDRLYGVPVTTRNWTTIAAIGRVLGSDSAD